MLKLKSLLALGLFLVTPCALAGIAPVKGEVLETMNAGGYTYMRLKTGSGETWAAVNRANVSKGAKVSVENPMEMEDFESRSLKRTFPKIVFGSLAASGNGAAEMAAAHAGVAKAEVGDVRVPKAVGANARTVAEIVTRGGELKDKPVLVRGKIVKYNPGIMGKNWVHLRDGSGSAADGSNDVLVTTNDKARLGDVVSVQGLVRVNKDFGAGYSYKVIIEDATLKP